MDEKIINMIEAPLGRILELRLQFKRRYKEELQGYKIKLKKLQNQIEELQGYKHDGSTIGEHTRIMLAIQKKVQRRGYKIKLKNWRRQTHVT